MTASLTVTDHGNDVYSYEFWLNSTLAQTGVQTGENIKILTNAYVRQYRMEKVILPDGWLFAGQTKYQR